VPRNIFLVPSLSVVGLRSSAIRCCSDFCDQLRRDARLRDKDAAGRDLVGSSFSHPDMTMMLVLGQRRWTARAKFSPPLWPAMCTSVRSTRMLGCSQRAVTASPILEASMVSISASLRASAKTPRTSGSSSTRRTVRLTSASAGRFGTSVGTCAAGEGCSARWPMGANLGHTTAPDLRASPQTVAHPPTAHPRHDHPKIHAP
jgi:hypothetical protein